MEPTTHGKDWSDRLFKACQHVMKTHYRKGHIIKESLGAKIKEASEQFKVKAEILQTILIDRG